MNNAEQELKIDVDAFMPTLLTRPMGTALFKVSQFNEWIENSGIECPVNIPEVKYYPVEIFLFRVSVNTQTVFKVGGKLLSQMTECQRKLKILVSTKRCATTPTVFIQGPWERTLLGRGAHT